MTAEQQRLEEARSGVPWRRWGPYLSERQWGTVREDYSDDGNAWAYFSHDQARSRAYRWGEDGLAGLSDDKSQLCFALALWNGRDPILKERLFGLTNAEGNHGEDVKEYYFYLDNLPSHAYMKWLYKYPQRAYPYDELVRVNRERGRGAMEYELLDTGVFEGSRYFDVFVEYAKATPEDILIRLTVHNRGPEPGELHVLPTLWFRNTWSWGDAAGPRPVLRARQTGTGRLVVADHPALGQRFLHVEERAPLLFTENETNAERLFHTPNPVQYVKDGIDAAVVRGRLEAVNPALVGTKMSAHHVLRIPAGDARVVRLRLTDVIPSGDPAFGPGFDGTFTARTGEADAFYASLAVPGMTEDELRVRRQALAGMLWSKQHYFFDLDRWLEEHEAHPMRGDNPRAHRNRDWFHMVNDDVISMPDKWEYPWYAAWDLAFHTVTLAGVDVDFAKQQIELMLRDVYLHPSGQLPAYEWNFGDVNPPVHAWAALFLNSMEKQLGRPGDVAFLKDAFQKLLVNFTWWVNRKDPTGRNVFEGGFLGLDNIGVFDRSAPLPTGGSLEQADGTGWMAFYAQNMFELALELAAVDSSYEAMALKFAQHFMWITAAMDRLGGGEGMWDAEDGFFYDVLRLPDGRARRLKVRSLVGLLPFCAVTVIEGGLAERFPALAERYRAFRARHRDIESLARDVGRPGVGGRLKLSVLDDAKLRRILARLLDESEFFGPYGIRSLSRYHLEHPYVLTIGRDVFRVDYEPAESSSGLFGGNSNWRGPVWLPMNALIYRALLQYYSYYGDDFTVECPTGSGNRMTLYDVSRELLRRLAAIFLRDPTGRRPVYGGARMFQEDPHWRDLILFYEYFHGDNGAGLGASHQTGWTGLAALLLGLLARDNRKEILAHGVRGGVLRTGA
ncbi:MAG TPA: glucosidase [Myxococcaceae bacterium]|nr:glucosidase [Myxococcaceae bacterium]